MLPDNVLSSQVISGPFLFPRNRRRSPLVDYEYGGVDFNDPTEGLQVKIWKCAVEGGDVILSAAGIPPTIVYSRPGITEISFTFDSNMNPFLTFLDNTGAFYYWYDATIEDYRLSQLPPGSTNPRCTLDDKRPLQIPTSDIILAYTRDNSLYFRAQQDRFEDEYLLTSELPVNGVLEQIGMNTKWRLQFAFVEGERVAPPIVPLQLMGAAHSALKDLAYSVQFSGYGGMLPYTFSVSSGSLPTGLLLDSSIGVLSGTPTTPGTYTFTVQVTDGNSDTAEREFEIDIVEALQLSGELESSAVIGVAYSDSLSASGGFPPYTWSISSGALPDGLTLNTSTGEISGTPTVEDSFTFTLRVTDDEGFFDEEEITILVDENTALVRTNLFGGRTNGAASSSFTPPDNSLLVAVVGVCQAGGNTDPSGDIGISGGGLVWTPRLTIGSAVPWSRGIRIFTAPVTSGAPMTVTGSLGGGRPIHTLDIHLFAYENADVVSPTGESASSNTIAGGEGPQTLTLSAAPDITSEVVAVIHTNCVSASSPITPTAPWSEQYDNGGANIQMQTQTRTANTSTLVSWSGVGTTFGTTNVAAALEIKRA